MKFLFIITVTTFLLFFNSCITSTLILTDNYAKGSKKTNLRILLNDGDTITGKFFLPKRKSTQVSVKLATGEKIKIKSEDIAYIEAWPAKKSADSRKVRMYYTSTKEYKKRDKLDDLNMKYNNKKRWLISHIFDDNLIFYMEAGRYKLENNGNILGTNGKGYFVKKKNDDFPLKYHIYVHYSFQTDMARYFDDCPSLVEHMEENKVSPSFIDNYWPFFMVEYAK